MSERREPRLFGLDLAGRLSRAEVGKPQKEGKRRLTARIHYLASGASRDDVLKGLAGKAPEWQIERAKNSADPIQALATDQGPFLLVQPAKSQSGTHGGLLDTSSYAAARDWVGAALLRLGDLSPDAIEIEVTGDQRARIGALVGLELASYRYKPFNASKQNGNDKTPTLVLIGFDKDTVAQARHLGVGVNVARHLVNTPAERLNPTTYAEAVKELFAGSKTVKVDVLSGKRLEKERCGLLMAVGRGSAHPPCLIHISYRPTGSSGKRPIAFVGKGITFDSGGLDIKPSSGMRLMKKDMGGSATLVGLAYWLESAKIAYPCDIYLAVAENAVDQASFRPGDILISRKGDSVEIDNTDAEGRLVLADALDYAVTRTGKDAPQMVIDVATLTGAMRVGLGTRIAGMFATRDDLSDALLAAAQRFGDPAWRMPLVPEYEELLASQAADVANSSSSRFGGAITAALFLKRFVGQVPWAHFDVMAWAEKPQGPFAEAGGNGQMVQGLAGFLEAVAEGSVAL